ncbi:lasso peptide biosynthesis PqqD family chaperone [Virgibacillus sp. DJP39]|uniref:lasso peptide biosynthesis PqqD family chaperone n=1 Tax=Virgibacillus sp. DJP39 TaxID=3409790 RepID=UPI003BB79FD3
MTKNKIIQTDQLISQKTGNIVSDMDGEKVMLSIQNGKYYNLGEMGGEIWELIQEPISANDLVDSLLDSYEVEQNECKEQVESFLSMLLDEDLIKVE